MRLRTDSLHIAGWKRAHDLVGCHCTPEQLAASRKKRGKRADGDLSHVAHDPEYSSIEAAQPGDVWVLRNQAGGIVGYGLTCPERTCDQGAHRWDHARDCPHRYERDAPPCWTWTGSIDDGTLTANPSLHVVKEWGGCGWHGWLRNGEMVA